MQTVIEFDPSYALLTVALEEGESIKAEPGAMVAQEGVEMKTGSAGGGIFGRHPADDGRRVLLH